MNKTFIKGFLTAVGLWLVVYLFGVLGDFCEEWRAMRNENERLQHEVSVLKAGLHEKDTQDKSELKKLDSGYGRLVLKLEDKK